MKIRAHRASTPCSPRCATSSRTRLKRMCSIGGHIRSTTGLDRTRIRLSVPARLQLGLVGLRFAEHDQDVCAFGALCSSTATTLAEKVAGGWTFSPIFNYHSGFPYNPTYGGNWLQRFLSQRNGGNCNLRPASYTGGAGNSQSTDSFKSERRVTSPNGGTTYFTAPDVVVSNYATWDGVRLPRFQLLPRFLDFRDLAATRSLVRTTRISIWRLPRLSGCRQ